MRKTLHKYILREIAVPFLLGLGTFTSVLLMGRLLRLADMVVAKGVPLTDVLRLVLYLLPFFCLVTIPMAFLLSIMLAFGRLSGDSEITAMKSGGISLYGLMPPVLLFALASYGATAFITIEALPWGNGSFKQLVQEIAQTRADIALRERVFIDEFPGLILYLDRYDQQQRLMNGILIHDDRNPAEPTTIFAASGILVAEKTEQLLRLRLHDGSIHRSIGKSGYRLIQFQEYDLSINLSKPGKAVEKNELDMTFAELRANLAKTGLEPRKVRNMQLELHRRFSLPFACFVFALIGVPLGIQNQRSGKASGFSLSIIVIVLYYIMLSAGKALGEKGLVPPAVAVWTPNVVFTLIGIYLLQMTAAEKRLKLFEQAARLFLLAQGKLLRLRGRK